MALIKCFDCDREVSDQAPTCPHCGRPIAPRSTPAPKRQVKLPRSGYICESCGDVGFPKGVTPGSFIIEVILWLLCIVPGLIYTTWRISNRAKVCPKCRGKMVQIRSPRGRLLAQQFNPHVQIT